MSNKIDIVTDAMWEQINPKNRKIAEEFLKQQTHLSPQTLKQYRSGLRGFMWWLYKEEDDQEIYKLKHRHALRYQNYLVDAGLSAASIRFKRAVVSSICGYIEIYYSDEYPEFRNIYNKMIPNPPKAPVHKKEPLTQEELESLIEELKSRGEWQMVAWIEFTYSTGCRRAESQQLLKEVVGYKKIEPKKDKGGDGYYVTHDIRCKGRGKVGKVRKLPFDERSMDALKKWLEVRGEDDCPYMFVTKRGGEIVQLGESAFNYWCKSIFSPIVGRRVHPHMFRSTRATHIVVEGGKDIRQAQILLGHTSSETTEIYVVRDENDELDDLF